MGKQTAKKQARRKARQAKQSRSESADLYEHSLSMNALRGYAPQFSHQESDTIVRDQDRWEADSGPCGVPVSPVPTDDVRAFLLGGSTSLEEFDTTERTFVLAAEVLSERLSRRGWTFSSEQSSQLVLTWTYPPSEYALAEGHLEPLTTLHADAPDSLVFEESEFSLMVAGHTWEAGVWKVSSLDAFFGHLDAVEKYRAGDDLDAIPFAYEGTFGLPQEPSHLDPTIRSLMPVLAGDPTPIAGTYEDVPTDDSALSPWEPCPRPANADSLDELFWQAVPVAPLDYNRVMATIVDLVHGMMASIRVRATSIEPQWREWHSNEIALDRDLYAALRRLPPMIMSMLDESAVRPTLTLALPDDRAVRDYDRWIELWHSIAHGLTVASGLAKSAAMPDTPIPAPHRFLAGSMMLTLGDHAERYNDQIVLNIDAFNAAMDAADN